MKNFDPKAYRDNPARIAEYLTQAFATDDFGSIMSAINNVMRAQNVSALSKDTGLIRDRMYKSFGGEVDPLFGNILRLLSGLGVQIAIKPQALLKPRLPRPKLGRPKKTSRPVNPE